MGHTPGHVTCLGEQHSTHTTHAIVFQIVDPHFVMFPFDLIFGMIHHYTYLVNRFLKIFFIRHRQRMFRSRTEAPDRALLPDHHLLHRKMLHIQLYPIHFQAGSHPHHEL